AEEGRAEEEVLERKEGGGELAGDEGPGDDRDRRPVVGPDLVELPGDDGREEQERRDHQPEAEPEPVPGAVGPVEVEVDRFHRGEHDVGREPEALLRQHAATRMPEEEHDQEGGGDPEGAQVLHAVTPPAKWTCNPWSTSSHPAAWPSHDSG